MRELAKVETARLEASLKEAAEIQVSLDQLNYDRSQLWKQILKQQKEKAILDRRRMIDNIRKWDKEWLKDWYGTP